LASENDQTAIEHEFSESWDHIEKFYAHQINWFHNAQWLKPIFGLIAELRKRGYDKKLRAGQGMMRFQLSRSREHGLRLGQPMLGFAIQPDKGMEVVYYESPHPAIEFKAETVEITPEIEDLLTRLLSHPID
jgi:hypothetical protein